MEQMLVYMSADLGKLIIVFLFVGILITYKMTKEIKIISIGAPISLIIGGIIGMKDIFFC